MARAPRIPPRSLPDSVRQRLEVATAMSLEALSDAHVEQARQFVHILQGRVSFEDALARYIVEMDLDDSMAVAVRTRTLAELESEADDPGEPVEAVDDPDDDEGWRRFRPSAVIREMKERQRRDEQTDMRMRLALARAEEGIIITHVENAITFAALLEEHMPLDRAVMQYLGAVVLSGGRAQAVLQRTMARLADAHLPTPQRREDAISR